MSQGAPEETKLVVVPDANMLIHGKALQDMPWTELGRDQIEIVYVPPVIREIDNLKIQSGRPNKLARQVSAGVRALRKTDDKSAVVRERSPQVVRRLALNGVTKKYHKSLKLDHADQALINYCLALKAAGDDVLLLTNDTICASTADDVGLPVLQVDDHWLRDPEPDDRDRENARLTEQIRRISSAEPQIETAFSATDGTPISALEAQLTAWPALTGDQLADLMEEIEKNCPMASSFERPKEPARTALFPDLALIGLGKRSVYTPPTDAEIEVYKAREYPKWLELIREKLEHLHETLEKRTSWPSFVVQTANNGSRPADAVLIKVQARGEIEIENLDAERNDDTKEPHGLGKDRSGLILPLPPAPPRGKTETIDPFDFGLGIGRRNLDLAHLQSFNLPHMPQPRRPDRFYWCVGEEGPTELFELECAAWRHSESQIRFRVGVRPYNLKETAGAVEFTVHASNLSVPHSVKLPIRISTVDGSTIDKAGTLVESLSYCARTEKRL